MIYTTFALAKEAGACYSSYKKFGEHVGGITKYGRTKPIPLSEVRDVLGIDDALWIFCYACKYEVIDLLRAILRRYEYEKHGRDIH